VIDSDRYRDAFAHDQRSFQEQLEAWQELPIDERRVLYGIATGARQTHIAADLDVDKKEVARIEKQALRRLLNPFPGLDMSVVRALQRQAQRLRVNLTVAELHRHAEDFAGARNVGSDGFNKLEAWMRRHGHEALAPSIQHTKLRQNLGLPPLDQS
jgi:hypothetical protein